MYYTERGPGPGKAGLFASRQARNFCCMVNQSATVIEAPKLHPDSASTLKVLVEQRLAAALMWLYQAAVAGFRHTDHIQCDPDLTALRLHRPVEFQLAMNMANKDTRINLKSQN